MRLRTLAVLLVVVAGLLAFIWFYERELPSSDERAELAKRVLRVEAEEIRGLTLVWGDSRVRLEREPAGGDDDTAAATWWLREPLASEADSAAVGRLVEALAELEKDRTLEGVEPAELGLVDPRGRVTLDTDDGPLELIVGSKVPASSTMIVGVAGRAHVVADQIWSDLTTSPGDWRNKDLGPDSQESIVRVALMDGERRLTLGRRGESFWVETPYVDRADRELVSDLLGDLSGLRVEKFVDQPAESPTELGLEPAAGVVEVVLEGQEEALRVELGRPAGEDGELRLARVGDQTFETRTDLVEAVARPAEEWRELAWTSFEAYQIDRLTVSDASGEMVLERDAGDWLRDGVRVAYTPVSDLLYALAGAEAEAVGQRPVAGEPLLTLVLAVGEDDRLETLTLFPAAADGSPARVSGRDVVLLLAEGTVSDLRLKLDEVRQAEEEGGDDVELESITED